MLRSAIIIMGILVCHGCDIINKSQSEKNEDFVMISKSVFGKIDTVRIADLYTLSNGNIEVKITNYGGAITAIRTPDKSGQLADVVLGFDNIESYLDPHPFFGVIVGRYGNRIANAAFKIDDKSYTLEANNGLNSLHGGNQGFDKRLWSAEIIDDASLKLSYISKDGEEGFPGNLTVSVTYSLDQTNSFSIAYEATTDQATLCNLTNHSYFNLDGHDSGDVLTHLITINANRFTPVNEHMIPTGEYAKVENTPFDFLNKHTIGERIASDHEQIVLGGGYDHNWIVNVEDTKELKKIAEVESEVSGRLMEVYTTEPGVQFYTGNFIDNVKGKDGAVYNKRQGFCLETQHFPDSPNQDHFPSTMLSPGEVYKSTTIYKFGVK